MRAAIDRAPEPDPYEILGVSESVSDSELRRAYHRMVHLHHPDHNGGSDAAHQRFFEIQRAYDDAMRRRKVDRRPHAVRAYAAASRPVDPSQAPPDDAVSVSPSMFTDAPRRQAPPREEHDLGTWPDTARQPWSEPWLDVRIAELERAFESRRVEQERAYREAMGWAPPPAVTEEPKPLVVERRRSRRPLSEWFREMRSL